MLTQFSHLPMGWLMLALLAILASLGFYAGRVKAERVRRQSAKPLQSRPNYHGYFVAMWAVVPAAAVAFAYALGHDVLARALVTAELPPSFDALSPVALETYLNSASRAVATGLPAGSDRIMAAVSHRLASLMGMIAVGALGGAFASGAAGLLWSLRQVGPGLRARSRVEGGLQAVLFICAAIAIATTIGIVGSLLFESLRFFAKIPVMNFLTGLSWNAQAPVPGANDFGVLPLFFGTFMIALIAMVVAAPVGLFAAIYLSEYAPASIRATLKPVLEVLAGIPTVVYGFFAASVVAPLVRQLAVSFNQFLISSGITAEPLLAAQPTSALAAGLVMGIMVIPFVSSLSDDVINAVPQTLRDAAFAMGATKSETVRDVVLPAALPGIIASLMLAISRAIGETMIVVMAAGQFARISADPTSDLTTITVQIVGLLTGETGFDDPKTLAAFALGLILFIVTLIFNLIALRVVRKYRERYE
jgi:phosphate transport system permease protein